MSRRHRLAAVLGGAGSVLGLVAGIVQAAAGSRIPEWTGAKAAPVALGLLTIGMSALAGVAAAAQRNPRLTVRARAACALGLAGPALLCLSTVGRLWYLPAALLLVAAAASLDSWPDTAAAVAGDWPRVLLSALGGFEALMAAGAAPVPMIIGGAGGIALITAAWLRTANRAALLGLVAVGTVPFAAVAWTAVVPVLLTLVAITVAMPLAHPHRLAHPQRTGRSPI